MRLHRPRAADVLRFFLGFALVLYGTTKLANTQFPTSLDFFDTQYAQLEGRGAEGLSGLSVFLLFFAYSRPYQIATGVIELATAGLLLSRRTWPLGALAALAVMVNVLLIDLCYGVWLNGTLMASLMTAGVIALLALARHRLSRALAALLGDPAPTAAPLVAPVHADASGAAAPEGTAGSASSPARPGIGYVVQTAGLAAVLLVLVMMALDALAAALSAAP